MLLLLFPPDLPPAHPSARTSWDILCAVASLQATWFSAALAPGSLLRSVYALVVVPSAGVAVLASLSLLYRLKVLQPLLSLAWSSRRHLATLTLATVGNKAGCRLARPC